MKPGDVVKVYRQPILREGFEGEARIVRMLSQKPCGIYEGVRYFQCVVNFPEDGPDTVVTRLVEEEYPDRRSGRGDTPPGTPPDRNLKTPEDGGSS